MRAKIEQWLFTLHLAFGGIMIAMQGLREMSEQPEEELVNTSL